MDIFSERFKDLKSAKGITYKQIAEALDLKERVIKCYGSGDAKPSYNALVALADYFDVSLDYLCGRSDDPKRR